MGSLMGGMVGFTDGLLGVPEGRMESFIVYGEYLREV
jgi:hypothetical protein